MPNWTGGLEGAGGGAMAGASIGGPWGAVIGGGIGLLGGLFGDNGQDQTKQMLNDYYSAIQKRDMAPQASYSDFRGNQQSLVNRLEAMANGQGPSLAAQEFQQATDRNNAAQQSMANSGRGGPMAQLTAANNMAGMGAQTAQGAAMGRTAEELGAIGQLGGVINQGRNSDESMNMANMESKLRLMGLNDSAIQAIIAGQMGVGKQPSMGDQILAGGAGMFSLGASQNKGGGMGGAGAGLGGLAGSGNGLGGAAAGIGGGPRTPSQGGGGWQF